MTVSKARWSQTSICITSPRVLVRPQITGPLFWLYRFGVSWGIGTPDKVLSVLLVGGHRLRSASLRGRLR
jgi:hypothetical protein